MKRLLISLLILCTSVGCKHQKNRSLLQEQYGNDSIDALILTEDLVKAPKECRVELMNLMFDALDEGLLRNGALTGLGTENPVGKKLKTDSAYFQGVRIVSILDWELGQRINAREPKCLPEYAGLHLSTFPLRYNESLSQPFPDDVNKLKKATLKINKSLGLFDVLSLDAREDIQAWPTTSAFPPAHQAAMLQGVLRKLRFAQEASSQNTNELEKLKGLLSSFSPLSVIFQGQFTQSTNRYYLEAQLPPLFELEDINLDDIKSWKLRRGIKKRKLSKPVQISVATLTHIGYLPEFDDSAQPVIKVQLFKDFNKPDLIKTRVIFGRISPSGSEKGTLPIDFKNFRDSFYISFYPNLEIKPDDNGTVKNLKTQFNELLGSIKVDARIHQLTLNLQRAPVPNPGNANDLMLAPKFSLKDSDISFRVHRTPTDEGERKILRNIGFVCDEQECIQDFGAYSDLRDFVLKGDQGIAQGRLTTVIGSAFKSLLNSVTRFNVKFIVDWNLPEIEAAVDKEFAAIIEDLVVDQLDVRSKISQKLEQRLFQAQK